MVGVESSQQQARSSSSSRLFALLKRVSLNMKFDINILSFLAGSSLGLLNISEMHLSGQFFPILKNWQYDIVPSIYKLIQSYSYKACSKSWACSRGTMLILTSLWYIHINLCNLEVFVKVVQHFCKVTWNAKTIKSFTRGKKSS